MASNSSASAALEAIATEIVQIYYVYQGRLQGGSHHPQSSSEVSFNSVLSTMPVVSWDMGGGGIRTRNGHTLLFPMTYNGKTTGGKSLGGNNFFYLLPLPVAM